MSAATAFINGTELSTETVARTEAFYEKLIQLHKDVLAGKNTRLSLVQKSAAAANLSSHSANAAIVASTAHIQAEPRIQLPGLDDNASKLPSLVTAPAPKSSTIPAPQPLSTASNGLPPKTITPHGAEDPLRIKKARDKLEKLIAEYAKAEEPIVKHSREIPLNLLVLAQARVPPISGFKRDTSEDTFDADSYYSSKANSWSTEHTEPQAVADHAAIVISDEEDEEVYEPPSQMAAPLGKLGNAKSLGTQHQVEPVPGQWTSGWEEEDEYEPPASADYGNLPQRRGQSGSSYVPGLQAHDHMPTIAVNQIPAPVAPQPSRISPLATGNVTQTMQSQLGTTPRMPSGSNFSNGQQPAPSQAGPTSAKEAKRLRRLAKQQQKQAAAGAESSSKKRKRAPSPDKKTVKKGKRRALASPEPYIKPEPASPRTGLATIPSRRPSVVQHSQTNPPVLSSPYHGEPRTPYMSDLDQSPRSYQPPGPEVDRIAMPPPSYRHVERDSQDLRRVASLQYARRPQSPRAYVPYHEPRAPPPRQELADHAMSRASAYREGSARPYATRPARSPSPPAAASQYSTSHSPSRLNLPPPAPGQIVEDAYGNRYIAELVPDDYPPPTRRVQPEAHYPQDTSRRTEYVEDPFRPSTQPSRSRAYSHVPEPLPIDRSRAYSRMPEPAYEPRPQRAYSVHPAEPMAPPRSYGQTTVYQPYVSPSQPPMPSQVYPQRPYSVHPDSARHEPSYSYTARSGSMAPPSFGSREMGPPVPLAPSHHEPAHSNAEHRYDRYSQALPAIPSQYHERRSVTYRH